MEKLDYSLYYASERVTYVNEILSKLDCDPPESELEKYANYILYGHDEDYITSYDDKSILRPNATIDKHTISVEQIASNAPDEDRTDSLTQIVLVDNSTDTHARNHYVSRRPTIKRSTYDESGNLLIPGDDFDLHGNPIPEMRELWERIDYYKNLIDQYSGKIPQTDWVREHPAELWKLRFLLRDLQHQQYEIYAIFHHPIPHVIKSPSTGEPDLDSNAGFWLTAEEWCARKRQPKPYDQPQPSFQNVEEKDGKYFWRISSNKIDYENPLHIKGLIKNYISLLKSSYERLTSETKMICMDFQEIINRSTLTEEEERILYYTFFQKSSLQIQQFLFAEGYVYETPYTINNIRNIVIPKKLAAAATKMRLESDPTIPLKYCSKCHRRLPAHPLYFYRSKDKTSGFTSQCIDCQKKEALRRKYNGTD